MATEKIDMQADEGQSAAGKLAKKFGISVFKAREIIDECGEDLACREARSLQVQMELKSTGDV